MQKGKWDILDKWNTNKIIVGYDLGDENSQISYCCEKEEEPRTLSVVTGEEIYNIPTVLCKRKNVNQWYFGKEAIAYASEEGVELIDQLVTKAIVGEDIEIENEVFSPIALLTLYIKRSLSFFAMEIGTEKIGALMITCRDLSPKMVEILETVAAGLNLKTKFITFQSYVESIYYYMLHQPEELWKQQVLFFDYCGKELFVYRMECNKHTTPIVTFIHKENIDTQNFLRAAHEKKDEELLKIVQNLCNSHQISTSYLLGEGFKEQKLQETILLLCRNKRLFQGNNLYSKGACFATKEKIRASENAQKYVFLGEEKLKSNIGMQVVKRGENSYFALLDAGLNWYEAKKECEFYLEDGSSFELKITPLDGEKVHYITIDLEQFPNRNGALTKLYMKLYMLDEVRLCVIVEDRGFGEFFPSGQFKWTQEIRLD